ncbi:MAG: substrate-binding domain-containing protein [Chthoniobacteraceae bacterium]|nr:substrate-binding domain-containing protein [Chthoniobacteraceae bacterium]
MHHRLTSLLLLWVCLGAGISGAMAQDAVRACGTVSLALPMADAVVALRTEQHVDLVLRAGGGTETGLDALGTHTVDLALCSRNLTPADRADYPQAQLKTAPVGLQLLSLAVSRDVWVGGLRALSAEQARGIYEGRINNWKEVGGPDLRIRLFMAERGRGQWEIFAQWLYGEIRKAPMWNGSKVKGIEEARNTLEFTPGSCALLPPAFTDYRNLFALSILDGAGRPVQPTVANAAQGKYPLSRPLLLVTDDNPAGPVKVVVDFMVSERGQELIKRYGYIGLEELQAAQARK